MKKSLFLALVLGVVGFFLVFFSLPAHSDIERLRVVLDWDYPPFTSIDRQGKFVGISVDFWKRFEEKTGVQVALIPMEWNMAHQVMLRREAEVIDTLFYTPERDLYLDYTRPLFPITSSIYHRKNLDITSFQDLTPHIVGVKEKDALAEIALRANPSIQLRWYKSYSEIVEAAKREEIAIFLMDDPPANYHLVKQGLLYEFSRIPIPVSNAIHLATWEGNQHVLALLNNGLARFSEEELRALMERYMVEAKEFPPWLFRIVVLLVFVATGTVSLFVTFTRLLKRRIHDATRTLEAKNRELEETQRKILKTIEAIAQLPFFTAEEKVFFRQILDLALETIPKAHYGSVLLLDGNGRGKLVVLRGHDERLTGFTFEKEDLLAFDEATITSKLLDPQRPFSSPTKLQRLLSLSRPIAESLFVPLRWNGRVFGHVDLDIPLESRERFTETDVETMKNFARICEVFYALRRAAKKEEQFLEKLLSILIKALEYYDRYTRGHSDTAARYALKIAERLFFDAERAKKLYWATFIHDVGKIFIPQEILNKPTRLTDEEYALVKLHPVKSAELILGVEDLGVEDLTDIAFIIRHHHERWDGAGYPDGLRGEEIPLESRIIALVDAFEAMTSDRPYKRSLSAEEALEELRRCQGTQFDPNLTEILIAILEEELQQARNFG